MNKLFNGIDVSKWQGDIDWQKVKAAGMQFAMLRDGFGRYAGQADETFEKNYQNEDETQKSLSKDEISDIVTAFCETLENAGYYVSVYMNLSWLNTKLRDGIFQKYDIWLAHWAKETTFGRNYGIWQYASDGTVDGIKGRVDMDYAYKNYPSIMASKGLNGYPKNGGENPVPPAEFPAKMMVTLHDTPLYVSATAKTVAARKSGTFYIYDGKEMHGRYRITVSAERAGKRPIAENVTGYVNKSDLR